VEICPPRRMVSVKLTLTCRRLLRGISMFSSARLFVSLPKIYSTTACLPSSTPAILSMVTRRISRSAVLPRLTAAEADNRHFQGLRHSLNTPTFHYINMCHAIHSWVVEQDEANTDSDAAPDFESMFDVC
jgi:hypothetical protein